MSRLQQFLIVGVSLAVALIVAVVLAVLPGAQAGPEPGASEQALAAAAARNTGLAEAYSKEATHLQQARAAEAARYAGLAEAYTGKNTAMNSNFLAANPEVMAGQRYSREASPSLSQVNTIRRVGLTEFLAMEQDARARAIQVEAARYTGLAEAYAPESSPGRNILADNPELLKTQPSTLAEPTSPSAYLAANPELMAAQRYAARVEKYPILSPGH